jgi:hypothetical protein
MKTYWEDLEQKIVHGIVTKVVTWDVVNNIVKVTIYIPEIKDEVTFKTSSKIAGDCEI